METLLLLATATSCSGMVLVLLPTGVSAVQRQVTRGHLVRSLTALLSRLGSGRVGTAALRVDDVRSMAALMARSATARRWGLGLQECAGLLLVCGVGSVLAGWVIAASVAGAVVGAMAFVCAVPARVAIEERSRERAMAREMPQVFRSLAAALAAGQTLSQAVAYVGTHEQGVTGDAFARAGLRMSCGDSATVALEALTHELDAPGMGLLSTAMTVSQRTGAPLRELFMRSASLIERAAQAKASLSVKTAQVRLSVRIVSMLPVIMVGLLALLSADFRQGLTSPVGMGCVCIAVVMDVIAIVVVRGLMRGVA